MLLTTWRRRARGTVGRTIRKKRLDELQRACR